MQTAMEKNLESKARRVARQNDCIARKSRRHVGTFDNFGGFMLIDRHAHLLAGSRYELSPEDVIDWFKGD